MKLIPLLLLIFSCTTDKNCATLYESRHHREEHTIDLTYISEVNDTIRQTIILTPSQLGNDNGVSFYVNSFKVGEIYCNFE